MNNKVLGGVLVALVVGCLVFLGVRPESAPQSVAPEQTVGSLSERDSKALTLVVGLLEKFGVNQYGGLTEGGDVLRINQTGATRTLTAAELDRYSQIVIDSTATGAALTLTLPATSTMTTLLPKEGVKRSWIIENNHTAAATTTTVAAGTGIDLQGLGTGDDIINAGVFGLLSCWRQYTTDVACMIYETVAAD